MQNSKPVIKTTYWLEHSYDAGQIKLLRDAVIHVNKFWGVWHAAGMWFPNAKVTLDDFLKSAITSHAEAAAASVRQSAAAVNKINEPLKKSHATLEAVVAAYTNTNYLQLREAALDPKLGYFFNRANFNPVKVIDVHLDLLDIVSNKVLPIKTDNSVFNNSPKKTESEESVDELVLCLTNMSRAYVERDSVKQQLQKVKAQFNSVKTTLNKEFVLLFEELFYVTELSLKNLELPVVKKIMEKLDAVARLEFCTDTTKGLLNIPAEVLNGYLAELKKANPALR